MDGTLTTSVQGNERGRGEFESRPSRAAQLRCLASRRGYLNQRRRRARESLCGPILGLVLRISGQLSENMAKRHTEITIRFLKGSIDSTEDIITIVHGMWDEGIGPAHDGTSRGDLEDDLGVDLKYASSTGLGHAVDTGLVDRDPHDSDDLRVFPIAEWMDSGSGEIVKGQVTEAAESGLEGIISHMQATDPGTGTAVADGGVTHRDVLADKFDIATGAVEWRLRSGDALTTLNDAVDAIEDSGHVSSRGDYGHITFRNESYSYTLSDAAVRLLSW